MPAADRLIEAKVPRWSDITTLESQTQEEMSKRTIRTAITAGIILLGLSLFAGCTSTSRIIDTTEPKKGLRNKKAAERIRPFKSPAASRISRDYETVEAEYKRGLAGGKTPKKPKKVARGTKPKSPKKTKVGTSAGSRSGSVKKTGNLPGGITKIVKKATNTIKKLPKAVVKAIPISIKSYHQAQLGAGWQNPAFKYLSIDGFRYTYAVILNYLSEPDDDSIFGMSKAGKLLVALERKFEMEIAFYPPNTEGHKRFKEFDVIITGRKNKILHQEKILNRMRVYTISK
ncbi:MAG: hypothetical protein GY866_15710 [Proteobacteria bacterium]|nr:hypothetical protein [Pseudomonadota bacterium]